MGRPKGSKNIPNNQEVSDSNPILISENIFTEPENEIEWYHPITDEEL